VRGHKRANEGSSIHSPDGHPGSLAPPTVADPKDPRDAIRFGNLMYGETST